jgi:hypothetical protein
LDALEEETNEFENIFDDEGSNSSQSNTFDHYVSPCEFRVSNDPMVVASQDVCDTTIYGCVRDHTFLIHARDGVIQLPVTFDYDVYYKFDSSDHSVKDMVDFLEGTMLEHLANLLDLKQCPSSPTSNGRNRDDTGSNRRRRLVAFTEEQKAAFIAVNSDPADNEANDGRYNVKLSLCKICVRCFILLCSG